MPRSIHLFYRTIAGRRGIAQQQREVNWGLSIFRAVLRHIGHWDAPLEAAATSTILYPVAVIEMYFRSGSCAIVCMTAGLCW